MENNAIMNAIADAIETENAAANAAAAANDARERAAFNAEKLAAAQAAAAQAEKNLAKLAADERAAANAAAMKKALAAECENAAKLFASDIYGFFRALHETEKNNLYYSIVEYEQIAENGEKLAAYAVCRINPFSLVAKSEREKANAAADAIADAASARKYDAAAILEKVRDIVNALCVRKYNADENGKKTLVKDYANALKEDDARDIYENAYSVCQNGKDNAKRGAVYTAIIGKLYRMVNGLPRNDARAEKRTQSAYASALKAYNAAENKRALAAAAADAAEKLAADALAACNADAAADAIENAAKLAKKARKEREKANAAAADARAKNAVLEKARAEKLAAADVTNAK